MAQDPVFLCEDLINCLNRQIASLEAQGDKHSPKGDPYGGLMFYEDAETLKQFVAAAVPIPRAPTEAMLNAARDWSYRLLGRGVGNAGATGCWQAMYDAAIKEKNHDAN